MTFVEERFPTDISYDSSGGPQYSTDVIIMASGHEQRNINWSQARARYNVAHGIKSEEQLQKLLAFFRARKGKAIGFRFKDWTDYKASNQHIAIGDNQTTTFQLIKTYESGGQSEIRKITKPVVGKVKVYLDGHHQKHGIQIDYTKGLMHFTTPPKHGVRITANFEFDVPVRFDTDQLSASIESYGVHSWKDIALVEIRV